MSKKTIDNRYDELQQEWEEKHLAGSLRKMPESSREFTTVSLKPIKRLYTPRDLANIEFERDIGFPGMPPYTRGIHPTGYRAKLWTMRQFAGFGSAFDTNLRFKYLLEHGQTGLSTAFDLPTLMGYDSDHSFSEGEVGKCGVAVSSREDMEVLFDGIPLDRVTTSMTINAPASMIFAFFIATAMKRGLSLREIGGTLQNDILKEYIAQKEWIYPPRPSLRLITDTFKFCAAEMPKWNSISISGYHMREAGATAAQELA
ncbi:MAG: methylmalonyl-CoA mutase, partial [Blastocatellia bacterium]|nr:methylmalonyl-CoA mutase [Blastocatellia bacterium]